MPADASSHYSYMQLPGICHVSSRSTLIVELAACVKAKLICSCSLMESRAELPGGFCHGMPSADTNLTCVVPCMKRQVEKPPSLWHPVPCLLALA